jgi:hypothetical protein
MQDAESGTALIPELVVESLIVPNLLGKDFG